MTDILLILLLIAVCAGVIPSLALTAYCACRLCGVSAKKAAKEPEAEADEQAKIAERRFNEGIQNILGYGGKEGGR